MTFPVTNFQAINFRLQSPTMVTTTINGTEERRQQAIPFFTFTASFENLTAADRRLLMGYIANRNGALSAFNITLPDTISDSGNGYTGTLTISAAAAVGATSVTISSSANTQTVLKAGDIIKFSNYSKVYMVTGDVTTTSGGAATINFYPALLNAVTTSPTVTVTHRDVPIQVRLLGDELGFDLGVDEYSQFQLDFKEVIA